MNEKIISRNTSKINSDTITVSRAIDVAKGIVEAMENLGVNELTTNELIVGAQRYFRNSKPETISRWVKELVVKNVKDPNVQGIPISKEKLIDLVQLKGDVAPLVTLLEGFTLIIQDETELVKRCVVISENGEVMGSPNLTNYIETRNTRKATTASQVKVLELVNQLISTINSIEQLAVKRGVGIDKDIDSPLHRLPYIKLIRQKDLTPNADFISMF